MREILFRGKAISRNTGYHRTKYKNGDWVYGLLTRLHDEHFVNLPAEMTNTDGVSGIEIDHNTVGQYTGLTDKNGTKIFEGDIVKVEYTGVNKGVNGIAEVVFKDCQFALVWGWHKETVCLTHFCNVTFEVIGNIHDDPELLEKEDVK
jgi:uncharacterized phage protein (TIGR01671 family)